MYRQPAALLTLRSLNLSHTTIGDKGATALCEALESMVQLTELKVRDCHLQDSGCALVATLLRECGQIEELDLSWNNLGSSACAAIIECLPLAQNLKVWIEIFTPQTCIHGQHCMVNGIPLCTVCGSLQYCSAT